MFSLINTLMNAASHADYNKMFTACQFPRVSQTKVLRDILLRGQNSEFGKAHRFSYILEAKGADELYERYRECVGTSEYEDYRESVERMMNGGSDILFEGKPVLYATTSGSTGAPKYIPITRKYLDDVMSALNRLMIRGYVNQKNSALKGKFLTVTGKRIEGEAPDGTPVGSVSALTRKSINKFITSIYAVPDIVYDIDDYQARNYTLMRFAIEQNVTTMVAPNPSTILELQNTVDQWLNDMILDIGRGTLSKNVEVPDDIREALKPYLHPNPKRAFELNSLRTHHERVLPRYYWPDLQVVCTWKCGNTAVYVKKLDGFFKYDVLHLELGYFATECRAGITIDKSNECVLMPHMQFFEFKRERDLHGPEAPFFRLWELKAGERYCPFVTTYNGLYRYNMNDIVQAAKRYLNAPRIHMVQKVNGIVSITGEKLYETQFIQAVNEAQKSTGLTLNYYTGYVNLEESRYDWYFEFANRAVRQKQVDAFASVVDDNLKRLNIEYKSKRESFRLKNPSVFVLEDDSFDKFKAFILNRNHRDASRFKPNVLAQNEEFHKVISRFIKKLDNGNGGGHADGKAGKSGRGR